MIPARSSYRARSSAISASVSFALLLLLVATAGAAPVQITGRFFYQDRLWDGGGYTGTTQDLPIRHADIEIVNALNQGVVGVGRTGADGSYAITIDLFVTSNLYVRCSSATTRHPDYHIWVVNNFVRANGTTDITNSVVHSIVTETQSVNPAQPGSGAFGDYLIEDATGHGVAQAFNILDNAIDAFDYLATSDALGRYPSPSEFVVYGWNGQSGSAGSNYQWQGIFITARPSDTDGWSDTVILHETGHWVSDLFGDDDNPGGAHILGDSFQDPRLSYGEGYATFFGAEVREFRARRDNPMGDPVDREVSIYADLAIPPPLPDPGGLEFAYDFETGFYTSGVPLAQIGSANETAVTAALWDVVDGVDTPDGSKGSDDDPLDDTGALSWDVTANYMPARGMVDWLTVEDFHDGWFVRHGPFFQREAMDAIFVGGFEMPFNEDPYEPDDDLSDAPLAELLTYEIRAGGRVVINEIDLGPDDRIELYNSGEDPVDMTNWRIRADRNGFPPSDYFFPPFVLYPGAHLVVHAGGDASDNGPVHLFEEFFLVFWLNGDDGACTLYNASGTAIDFLRWDNVNGQDPSNKPVPPGLQWHGTLYSAPERMMLGRDKDGADTDDASDFTLRKESFGIPNFDLLPRHHAYPVGDRDLVRLELSAGDLLTAHAFAPHSAGEPVLELLDLSGFSSGPIRSTYGIAALAELQFLAPRDTTLFVRVSNDAPFNRYAPIDFSVYRRPSGAVLRAPVSLVALPENESDSGDAVRLQWLNGSVYDSIRVDRDGEGIAVLEGSSITFEDAADRGLHGYEVRGYLGGQASEPALAKAFAGIVECHLEEGFESAADDWILDGTWARTSARAAEGSFSLTDSPAGNYSNNRDVSAELIPPAELLAFPVLEFDHICITEAGFDFGYVEISTDFGSTWTTLAQFDLSSYPPWQDGSADPGDWVHETIDLEEYLGRKVRIRFRLFSDQFLTFDGWYIDGVRLSDPACESVTAIPEAGGRDPLSIVWGPNPFRDRVQIDLSGWMGREVEVSVFDAGGRWVRTVFEGKLSSSSLTWDGIDRSGHRLPAGIYLLRVSDGETDRSVRVVHLR